jgi:hypothetical protein
MRINNEMEWRVVDAFTHKVQGMIVTNINHKNDNFLISLMDGALLIKIVPLLFLINITKIAQTWMYFCDIIIRQHLHIFSHKNESS